MSKNMLIFLAMGISTLNFSCDKLDFFKKEEKAKTADLSGVLKEAPSPNQLILKTGLTQFLTAEDSNYLGDIGYNRTSVLNITSLKIPIYGINIFDKNGSLPLYTCPSTIPSECMVELTGTALKSLLTMASQKVEFDKKLEKYDIIGIQVRYNPSYTAPVPGWNVSLKASAVVDDKTYYTTKTTGMSTTGPAEAWEVSGVSATNSNYYLSKPFELTDKSSINLNLFMDTAHIASLDLENIANACGANSPGCFQFGSSPEIIAAINTNTITVEHYVVSIVNDSKYTSEGCLGFLGIYVDETGNPIGGYMRNYFTPNQVCNKSTLIGGQMLDLKVINSTTVSFKIAGLSVEDPAYTYASFTRATHEGKFNGNKSYLNDLMGEHAYKATKL